MSRGSPGTLDQPRFGDGHQGTEKTGVRAGSGLFESKHSSKLTDRLSPLIHSFKAKALKNYSVRFYEACHFRKSLEYVP